MSKFLSRMAKPRARAGVAVAILATTLQMILLGASLGPGVIPLA